jgi:hypothetical protein
MSKNFEEHAIHFEVMAERVQERETRKTHIECRAGLCNRVSKSALDVGNIALALLPSTKSHSAAITIPESETRS